MILKGIKYALICATVVLCFSLSTHLLMGDSNYFSSSVTKAMWVGWGVFTGYGIGIFQNKSK